MLDSPSIGLETLLFELPTGIAWANAVLVAPTIATLRSCSDSDSCDGTKLNGESCASAAVGVMRNADPSPPSRALLYAPVSVLVVYILLGSFTLVAARLTGDEGWYTGSALEVLRGRVPYRDFLFTQMPAVPYVYAAWLAFAGHSLIAARTLSFLFGGLGVALTMTALHRKAGLVASVIAGCMLVANLSFMFDVCIVKTQALTVVLGALALWGASQGGSRRGAAVLLLSAAALVCTRLSMVPVLAFAVLHVWLGPARRALLVFGPASVALIAVAVLGPGSLDNLWFGVLQFHDVRYDHPTWQLESFLGLMLRGFVANQGPLIALGLGACAIAALRRRISPELAADFSRDARWLGFVVASYVATTAIHFSRPVAYPTYQTSNIVFLVAATAYVLARASLYAPRLRRTLYFALLPVMLAGAPFEEWVVHVNGDGGLGKLDDAVEVVRKLAHGNDPIFTASTEIAVQSGLPLLPGWELSEFSFFPGMSTEQAQARHVVNAEMLFSDVRSRRAQIVCLTQRHMAMLGGPMLADQLNTGYELRATIPRYGQFFETLYVLTRR